MIDLLADQKAWGPRQIAKRAELEVRKLFSRDAEMIINRKVTGAAQGVYTLTDTEAASVVAFQTAAFNAQVVARQAEIDNVKLTEVLAYEQAGRDILRLSLLIDGRVEVPAIEEVLEEIDPDTFEVLVEGVTPVALVPAIEPLALTVETFDEAGVLVVIDNPELLQAVADQGEAAAAINGATLATLELAELRAV